HRLAAAHRSRTAQRVLARTVPRPGPGGRVLARHLGDAQAARTLRPAGGPGQVPDHPLPDRRDPQAADRRAGRHPDTRQQRRAGQFHRDAAAAPPVRPGPVPRPVPDRQPAVPDRVLRPGQVRRVRGQLGERAAAPAGREPARVRGRVHAVPAAPGLQHHHADRPGQGLRDMVLLPTTVVGSYSVPEWLERLKTEYYQRRISAQHLAEINEVAIKAAVKDQELAGIAIVSDGELRRDNDVDYFLARLPGVHITQRAKTDYFDYYDAEVTRPLPEVPEGLGLA